MINFQNFGIDDNEKYLSYLKKCPQIPSDASPLNILNLQRKYNVRRGYTENFCWHKFILDGEDFFYFLSAIGIMLTGRKFLLKIFLPEQFFRTCVHKRFSKV